MTPNWRLGSERCSSCQSSTLRLFDAVAHDGDGSQLVAIAECVGCNFAWQSEPARTSAESVETFDQAYRPSSESPTGYFDPVAKRAIASIELAYLESLALPGDRLLDVGGGSGAFATAAAAAGWRAYAVDPALDTSVLTSEGVQAFRGYLTDLPPELLADVVTLWDVIEHVEEPLPFLHEVKARLATGGHVIIATGNYKSAGRLMADRTHWIYQLDHRWYFSPESLERLLYDAGLEVVARCPRVLRPTWSGDEDYAGPTMVSLLRSLIRHPLNASQALARFARLREARQWPQGGLEIFTLVARARRDYAD